MCASPASRTLLRANQSFAFYYHQQLGPSALAEVCASCPLLEFKQHGLDEDTGDVYIACTEQENKRNAISQDRL